MARNALGTRKLEIQHFSHSLHDLRFEYGSYPAYTCNGCRELGIGLRYHCRQCNFDMHESCARAPEFTSHFIDRCHHHLVFKEKTSLPSGVGCDVCTKPIEGFVYECRGCNIDLHPSCARLPHSLRHALHPHHTLQLVPSNSTPYVCNVCGRSFTSPEMRNCYCYWCCEGSTPCGFILHISCAKLPVDPLEEMRMQSIAPLEVPCGHMFTGAPSGTPAAAQVRSSSSTVRVAQVISTSSTGTAAAAQVIRAAQVRSISSTGTAAAAQVISTSSTGTAAAAQVISTSSTGAASSSSTGAATQAISSLDVLRTGSAVLGFTSSVLDLVNSLSDDK